MGIATHLKRVSSLKLARTSNMMGGHAVEAVEHGLRQGAEIPKKYTRDGDDSLAAALLDGRRGGDARHRGRRA